jgi:undecaprenyl-diphosphatase
MEIIKSVVADLFAPQSNRAERWSVNSRHAFQIVIGTIPVVAVGLAFRHIIEGMLTKSIPVIASSLIILAVILYIAEKKGKLNRDQNQTTWKDAIIVGMAQALALIPGSSRSGTTITAALFVGLTRQAAARFSFLLSIPAVLASGLYELYKSYHQISGIGATALFTATAVSGIVGYLSIAFLLKYLQSHTMNLFIVYRIILGVTLFGLALSGLF